MKTCSKCGEHKDLSCFGVNRHGKDGLSHWCKPCNVDSATRYAKKKRDIANKAKIQKLAELRELGLKVCFGCKEALPYAEFNKNTSTKDNLHSCCRPCLKVQRKAKDIAYRERNRERVRENGRKWQQANKDVGALYYQKNRDEILRRSREERAEANKEQRAESVSYTHLTLPTILLV